MRDESHREGESVTRQFERLLRVGLTPAKRFEMEGRIRKVNEAMIGKYNYVLDKPVGGTRSEPKPQVFFLKEHCPVTIEQLRDVEWEYRVSEGSRERLGAHTGRKQQHDEDFTDLVDYEISCPREKFVSPARRRSLWDQAEARAELKRLQRSRGNWAVR